MVGAVTQLLWAGMRVMGLFHREWLKPIGVLLGALIERDGRRRVDG